jgi:hypothetical protein
MAILMVYDRDNKHVDPEKDARGCYKRGYVVEVFEDDKKLVEPPAPPFLFIKVPGVSKADAEAKYMIPEHEEITASKGEGITVNVTRRRAVKIDLDLMDKADSDALAKSRVIPAMEYSVLKAKSIDIKTSQTLAAIEMMAGK